MTQLVTPYEVKGDTKNGIDYNKLIDQFGSQRISDDLLIRFEQVTGHKPHHWLKRGIFFSHRDLDEILNKVSKKESVYLYTGRGRSSESVHFGHLIPFVFTCWLQKVFDCPLVIQ